MATKRTTIDTDATLATGSPVEASTGEVVTFTLELPPPVHEAPADEAAVAIDDVAIQPHLLPTPAAAATTTITLSSQSAASEPEAPLEPASDIPPLPAADVPRRRVRGKGPEVATLPEPASALTDERLIVEPRGGRKPAPEGLLQNLLYRATFRLVNVGDSLRARQRKALEARIDKPFEGGTRFVAVLSRKGGVGKTTIATLLGMAMADVREDRVIAIDANPDRGTLAERIPKQTRATVRDLVLRAKSIQAFSEFQTLVSRDATRLDVLASDSDPLVADAFDEKDYRIVADLASRFYSVAITDCGTGIVHSAMRATLQRADAVVVVSGGSVDEARLASETLTWLESNGYEHLVENAVVALNTATQGTNLVKLEEIEAHFQSRVRDIVRMPYDPALATGSTIHYADLRPMTRDASRDLAALVVDGLPSRRES